MRIGILRQAGKAKEKTEKANEKEQIMLAYTSASMKSSIGNNVISKDDIQNELNSSLGQNKATVTSCGKGFDILINDKNYYYTIEEDGTITEPTQVIDIQYAGDITKNGKYDGTTLEKAYRIECIEDLVAFSNDSKTNDFEGLYVVLTRDLNFLSVYSYDNYKRTDFGDLNGKSDDGNELLTEMTTETGFVPISSNSNKPFKGIYTSKYNTFTISNLYINRSDKAGLFAYVSGGTIKNLTISGEIISTNSNSGGFCSECWGIDNIFENLQNNCKIISENSNAGGIIGYGFTVNTNTTGDAKITNCLNNGNIYTNNVSSGGIIGYYYAPSTGQENNIYIYNSYNSGNICGNNGCGGIIGMLNSDNSGKSNGYIYNCYNVGKIEMLNQNRSGGIYGLFRSMVSSTLEINNTYLLKDLNIRVGNSNGRLVNGNSIIVDTVNATELEKNYMQSDNFIDNLNNYIEGTNNEMNTNGWAKWVKGKDGYPTLDFNTIWNGTEWETN